MNKPYMENHCFPKEPNKKAYKFQLFIKDGYIEIKLLYNRVTFHTESFIASYGARFGIDVMDYDLIDAIIDKQAAKHMKARKK